MSRPAAASFSRNVLTGAGLGAALAGVCLLVGVLRMAVPLAFRLAFGRSLAAPTAADARMIGFYVGGFVLAGAFVGALRPVLRGRAAIYAALAAGGAVVMNTIAIADQGWAGMDRFDWIAMTALGAVFGSALAAGYLGDVRRSH